MNGEVRVTSSEIGLLGRLNAAARRSTRRIGDARRARVCFWTRSEGKRASRRTSPSWRRWRRGWGSCERTVATLDAHATAVEERMRKIRGNERAGVAGASGEMTAAETFPWDGFEKTRFRRPVSRAWKRTTRLWRNRPWHRRRIGGLGSRPRPGGSAYRARWRDTAVGKDPSTPGESRGVAVLDPAEDLPSPLLGDSSGDGRDEPARGDGGESARGDGAESARRRRRGADASPPPTPIGVPPPPRRRHGPHRRPDASRRGVPTPPLRRERDTLASPGRARALSPRAPNARRARRVVRPAPPARPGAPRHVADVNRGDLADDDTDDSAGAGRGAPAAWIDAGALLLLLLVNARIARRGGTNRGRGDARAPSPPPRDARSSFATANPATSTPERLFPANSSSSRRRRRRP